MTSKTMQQHSLNITRKEFALKEPWSNITKEQHEKQGPDIGCSKEDTHRNPSNGDKL